MTEASPPPPRARAPEPEPADSAPRASRYEVLAKIASGGMATVFVGRARGAIGFSRLVAIKRPHTFVSRDRAMQGEIEREARVASRIHHPHVVSILDVELVGDELSLILDYVEGGTLQDLSAHAKRTAVPLPTRVAVRIVLDTASGLHAAHALRDGDGQPAGVIHRDVSPQNILVGVDGQTRLTDFGIAKIADDIEQTATGILKGKLGYLPPEYVVSRDFDAQSDQYALAVVAWETLAGSRMFGGYNDGEVMRQIATGVPPVLSSVRPDLAPLDAVLSRALSRNPGERFESVAAFAEELEARAREHGWVSPHGEVGALVEAAVGDKVRERRSAIESSTPPRVSVKVEVRPRDAMATRSLAAEVLPPIDEPIEPAVVAPPPVTPGDTPGPMASPETWDAPTREIRAPEVPPSVPGWWPVIPVVVVAALTGFALTRGILAPRPSTSSGSLPSFAGHPQTSGQTPGGESPLVIVAESAPREIPGPVLAPSAATLSPVAESPPQTHAEPRAQPYRPVPRPGRRPAGAATASVAIPTRAPPNPYAP